MKLLFNQLKINEVEAFQKLLMDEIQSLENKILELDFEDIEEIDFCVIQLLISLKKYCDEIDINIKYLNVNSRQVKQAIKMFGLEKTLGISL
jgi:anti-anti-sigma regulatory factor